MENMERVGVANLLTTGCNVTFLKVGLRIVKT
jgi:hypothetical protein